MDIKKGVVDRFEGDIAVIEIGGETRDIPLKALPDNVQVGDIIIFDGKSARIDHEETAKKEREIKKLMDEVWED
jgi:hydrogenase maturation factor